MTFQELKNKVFGLERKVQGLQCCVSQIEGGGGGGGAVDSVFGRTGVVTAQSNDYTFAQIGSKPTTLSGYGITDGLTTTGDGSGLTGLTKTQVGLSNVENTALSTWAGSSNITTLGTITTGTWNGTTIATTRGGTGQTSFTNGRIVFTASGVLTDSSSLQYTSNMLGLGSTPTHTITLASTSTGLTYYNTSDQTTNYERVRGYWSSNVYNLVTENGGTGTKRNMSVNGLLFPANTTGQVIEGDATITRVISLSQAAYDAIVTKSSTTLYVII